MKRLSLLGFVGLLLASVLAGCPIFSGDGGSQSCVGYGCTSVPGGCYQPADCPQNETCGSDNVCHTGDCTIPGTGCLGGYTCTTDPNSGTASCQPSGTGMGGGTTTTTTSSTTSTSTSTTSTSTSTTTTTTTPPVPVYCGHPADCGAGQICGSAGTCQPGPCSATNTCIFGYTCTAGACVGGPNACDKDTDCTGGAICIAGPSGGGTCTVPANQCFDQSQCGTNEKCVAGKCILGCASNTDCRDGYNCDTTHGGVCTIPVKSCTVTNDCASASLVCVGGACVPRSTGGTCANAGDVWTENGCIPNQGATFNCTTEGQLGSGAGNPGVSCAAGSICLHRDCWISCDTPNSGACTTQTILNTCKPVVDGSSTYNVCGTAQNLGSQCGAGSVGNMTCSGASVCIDGYCK